METYVNYVTEKQISGQLMLETYKVIQLRYLLQHHSLMVSFLFFFVFTSLHLIQSFMHCRLLRRNCLADAVA